MQTQIYWKLLENVFRLPGLYRLQFENTSIIEFLSLLLGTLGTMLVVPNLSEPHFELK